jgi:hypothetical protein
LRVFALTTDGFAADLHVKAKGGIPSLATLNGEFRLVANLTEERQEVPVAKRFIEGGFLPAEFVAGLEDSVLNPGEKAYFVPAAHRISMAPRTMPRLYIVIMGAGGLKLVNAWEIAGDFRLKVETDGLVIPIDATLNMGPLGTATMPRTCANWRPVA